jgi:hypothetical protein
MAPWGVPRIQKIEPEEAAFTPYDRAARLELCIRRDAVAIAELRPGVVDLGDVVG